MGAPRTWNFQGGQLGQLSPILLPCPAAHAGKIHWKNTMEQLNMVGPRSLGVCLLTAAFVGMVFTIQFIR